MSRSSEPTCEQLAFFGALKCRETSRTLPILSKAGVSPKGEPAPGGWNKAFDPFKMVGNRNRNLIALCKRPLQAPIMPLSAEQLGISARDRCQSPKAPWSGL
jgi:hypothetical protein